MGVDAKTKSDHDVAANRTQGNLDKQRKHIEESVKKMTKAASGKGGDQKKSGQVGIPLARSMLGENPDALFLLLRVLRVARSTGSREDPDAKKNRGIPTPRGGEGKPNVNIGLQCFLDAELLISALPNKLRESSDLYNTYVLNHQNEQENRCSCARELARGSDLTPADRPRPDLKEWYIWERRRKRVAPLSGHRDLCIRSFSRWCPHPSERNQPTNSTASSNPQSLITA